MKITLNGKPTEIENNLNILSLLTLQNVKSPEMVTVELNEEILNKSDFETITLKENDRVELLFFMGGGAW